MATANWVDEWYPQPDTIAMSAPVSPLRVRYSDEQFTDRAGPCGLKYGYSATVPVVRARAALEQEFYDAGLLFAGVLAAAAAAAGRLDSKVERRRA